MLGGLVVGDLAINLESADEVLRKSAKRFYPWASDEQFDKALDRLIAQRPPGPHGPKTIYKLID